jgi:hypothetical protein
MALLRHLATLLCAAVLHGARPAAAQNRSIIVEYPTKVEFNVVFPRNETYAPATLFPIVFAVQNYPAAAVSTMLFIDYRLSHYPSGKIVERSQVVLDHLDDLDPRSNTSAADPYYAVVWTNLLSSTNGSGQYALQWEFSHHNCSGDFPAAYEADFGPASHGAYFELFTVAADGKQPDVAAEPHTCPHWYSAAIEINGTTPVLQPAVERWQFNDGRSVCAVVSETPPPADPCAARIDESAAAAISARMTASACGAIIPALTSGCPSPTQTQETNIGSRAPVGGGFGMGLTGMLSLVWALVGFLLFLVL